MAPLLKYYWDHGVPVHLEVKQWAPEQLEKMLKCGPHPSMVQHSDFIHGKMADFLKSGFWAVLLLSLVCLLLANIFKGYKKFDPESNCHWPINTTIMQELLASMDLLPG